VLAAGEDAGFGEEGCGGWVTGEGFSDAEVEPVECVVVAVCGGGDEAET
jgi:hypothetical protein